MCTTIDSSCGQQHYHCALHRVAFCQSSFRWIYYYGTGKETGKSHLCALVAIVLHTWKSIDPWKRKQCTKHAELELMKRLFNVVERNYHMTSEP